MKIQKSLLLVSIIASSAIASGFNSISYESTGMGNAGVANSSGSFISYYNPALLANKVDSAEFSLSVGAGYQEHNTIDNIEKLDSTYNLTDTMNEMTYLIDNASDINSISMTPNLNKNLKGIMNTLKEMNDSNVRVTPHVSFSAQWDNFSLSVYNTIDVSAKGIVSKNHDQMIFDTSNGYVKYNTHNQSFSLTDYNEYKNNSIEYAIDNELTYLDIKGMNLTEVPLSYGKLINTAYGKVKVGGSLKYMLGKTFSNTLGIDSEIDDIKDFYDENKKSSSNFGIDLGIAYEPIDNLNIGLVGKNLNSPKFETSWNEDLKLEPQSRIGVSYRIYDWIDIAADYDLTKNKIFSNDTTEQYIGGGVNVNPLSWLSVRAGAMKNLENKNEGIIATAGLGFGFKWFQFDVSGQMSNKTSTYDGEDIPKMARINFALISRW